MDTEKPDSASLVGSLKTLGDSLLAGVQKRIELFSTELQEEKIRLIQILIWISAIVLTGVMSITFISLTVVYLFWESARFAALSGMAVGYTVILIAIIITFRRFMARQPSPFSATCQEIGEDRSCIHNKS